MNAADPVSVKTRNRRERRSRARELDDLRWVMADPKGRRIVWALLVKAGISRISFSSDALQMAFLEGSRNLGLMLQADVLEACADLYLLAMDEAKTTLKRDDEAEVALTETPEKEDEHG